MRGTQNIIIDSEIVETYGPNILDLWTSKKLEILRANCALMQTQYFNSVEDLKVNNPKSFDKIDKFQGTVK